jgi:hydrogenase maturation protease
MTRGSGTADRAGTAGARGRAGPADAAGAARQADLAGVAEPAGQVVVIGVGNEYRRDDGLGPAVIERLRRRDLPGVRLATTDGEPARLIDLWAGAALAIVVDAARAAPPRPGRIHRLTLDGPSGWRGPAGGSHGLGLGDAVDLAAALGLLPGRIVIYAVEPADLSFGAGLSPPVGAAVGPVADAVTREITADPAIPAAGEGAADRSAAGGSAADGGAAGGGAGEVRGIASGAGR